MERMVMIMQENFEDYLSEKQMKNIINQDPKFYDRFTEEWKEITKTLRQIHEASKIKTEAKEKEVIRPTSNSVIFK